MGPDQERSPRFVPIVRGDGFATLLYSGCPHRAHVLPRLLFCVTNTKPTVGEIACLAYFKKHEHFRKTRNSYHFGLNLNNRENKSEQASHTYFSMKKVVYNAYYTPE